MLLAGLFQYDMANTTRDMALVFHILTFGSLHHYDMANTTTGTNSTSVLEIWLTLVFHILTFGSLHQHYGRKHHHQASATYQQNLKC